MTQINRIGCRATATRCGDAVTMHSAQTVHQVDVNIDGQHITVPCVVEGKGSTLFGYGFYSSSRVSIPLKDINHSIVEHPVSVEGFADSVRMEHKIRINPVAMQDALSVRFSDLKILSVGTLPELDMPKK